MAQRRRPRKADVYEQLHRDAGTIKSKIQQKRLQQDQDTLKVDLLPQYAQQWSLKYPQI